MSDERFEDLVGDALDQLPRSISSRLDNVVILVEAAHVDDPHLLGLYQGVSLTERDSHYSGFLPDTITIYRDSILAICATEDEVVREVAVTVLHEIGHYFGIDEDRLHELGWG